MKIEFSQSGGFGYIPGLQKPVVVDVDRLGPADQDELKKLISAADFFAQPKTVGTPAKGAADYQHNIVTVEDSGRRHTVKILVPSEDAALRALVHAIQRHATAVRAALRGGGGPSAGESGQ
ncbi:protealysin inhibitor emfourin [Ideonella sp. YS5]|uniref:protealysin inhibitor emfourin n=1 Tax=Ideonella sp. YS5 TaxID=3453714 RepID=UPI003EEBDA3A